MNFNSRTREGSKNFSRLAGMLQVSQANLPLGQIGGTHKFGSVTVDQLQQGVEFPNIQSALDDVVNSYQTPIGGVVIIADDVAKTPDGTSMTERLAVSGMVQETGTVEVYGIPVSVQKDDNNAAVATKLVNTLTAYKDKGIAIKSVELTTGSNFQLDVTFIDTNPHDNFQYVGNGITISGTTSTQAVSGYGTWTRIAEQTIVGVAGGNVTMHYWKRIA